MELQCESPDFRNLLNSLREKNLFCDAIIETSDGEEIRAHRCVLAACSKYFLALFTAGMSETHEQRVKITQFTSNVIEAIVEFAYTWDIPVSDENVEHLIPAADHFGIDPLLEKCFEYLKMQVEAENVIGIYEFSKLYNGVSLKEHCWRFILNQFEDVMNKSLELLDVDISFLRTCLTDNELGVPDEKAAYEAVIKWTSRNVEQRTKHLPELLNDVRLELLPDRYFTERIAQNKPLLRVPGCRPIVDRFVQIRNPITTRGKDIEKPFRPRVPRNVVFCFGGWCGGKPTNLFETYDCRSDKWFLNTALWDTESRAYHGVQVLGQIVYVLGGFNGQEYFSSVRCFDPERRVWFEKAPMHDQRCYVACGIINGKIYACGGHNGRTRLNSVERYDPTTNQWEYTTPMHASRSDAGAGVMNGKIYITGGFNGHECLNSGEVFDSETEQWSMLPRMSSSRSGVSTVVYAGKFYALGGFDGLYRLATVECFCPDRGDWLPTARMGVSRSNFTTVVVDKKLYAIGGFNGVNTISDVECYDPETQEWKAVQKMNVNRSAIAACVVPDLTTRRVFTFHGQSQSDPEMDCGDSDLFPVI